jgi:hypothetical protein
MKQLRLVALRHGKRKLLPIALWEGMILADFLRSSSYPLCCASGLILTRKSGGIALHGQRADATHYQEKVLPIRLHPMQSGVGLVA